MKVFFQSFLYLNVGLGSLFFVIWLLTAVPFFQSSARAEEPSTAVVSVSKPDALSEQNKKTISPPEKLNVGPPDTSASMKKSKESTSASSLDNKSTEDDSASVQRKAASIADAPSPPPPPVLDNVPPPVAEDTATSPPPSPVGENSATSHSNPSPVDNMESSETEAGENQINKNVSFPSNNSSDLNNLLESTSQFQKATGTEAGTAHDLININQKVVEIYKMLSDYRYDSNGRRDPFSPFKKEETEVVFDEESIPDYPTGRYNLKEITLVGIKWNSKVGPSKALFKTPDNVMHHLQKNDRIGRNRGIIYRLEEDAVVILEPRLTGTVDNVEDTYVPIIVRLDRVKQKKDDKNLNIINEKKGT